MPAPDGFLGIFFASGTEIRSLKLDAIQAARPVARSRVEPPRPSSFLARIGLMAKRADRARAVDQLTIQSAEPPMN